MKTKTQMLSEIKEIFETVESEIAKMESGARCSVKDLVEKVTMALYSEQESEMKKVLPFVSYFLHNSNLAYVTPGKNGGVIKGTRIPKEIKIKKPTTKPAELLENE